MRMRVVEGDLITAPGDGGQGTHRRAFGEFIGPRGELASYAIGWCTCGEHDGASISVGIGAGNPGGGTFHAAIVPTDDGIGVALVDDALASLPQGGPHLTAEDARAHEDLPFIWAVVDVVLDRDRRALWMAHWLGETTCEVTTQIADGSERVLSVVCDTDGIWRLAGSSPPTSEIVAAHLHHVIDQDPSLLGALDLAPGQPTSRTDATSPWQHRTTRPAWRNRRRRRPRTSGR